MGLSQRTAPVALRERLSKVLEPSGCVGDATRRRYLPGGGPAFGNWRFSRPATASRSTGFPTAPMAMTRGLIVARLAELADVARDELEPHIYYKEDEDAVRHLLRVACGLDSQVLGETQILGQVSQAFASARSNGTSGPLLTYLFSRASHAGKRAQSETEISRGSHLHQPRGRVPAGEGTGGSVVTKYPGGGSRRDRRTRGSSPAQARRAEGDLRQSHPRPALRLSLFASVARRGRGRSWPAALASADAVITATGSPHPVIYADDVAPILEQRQGVPLVFVDIAVPRDVDLAVGALPGVVLHDIDKLEATLDQNLSRRFAAVPEVEEIVARETQVVMEWLHGREATDLLAELREHARAVADAELRGALRKLDGLDKNTEEVISRMANRIVSKLLHQPTKQLKARASSEDFEVYCDAVVDLFGLEHKRALSA